MAYEVGRLKTVQELGKMRHADRDLRFKKAQYTKISERLYGRLKFFVAQYYGMVDTSKLLGEEPAVEGEEAGDVEEMRIDDLLDLLTRKEQAVNEVRKQAKRIRSRFGDLDFDRGLAGLFTPREGHAKDVSEWLGDL